MRLSEVPDNIPAEAEVVRVVQNEIADIKPGVFSHLSHCKHVSLNSNVLTEVKKDMWDGLQALESLGLSQNSISNIEVGSFVLIGKCKRISLSKNLLKTLRKDMWTGLPNLEVLNLSGNMLTDLTPGTFAELSCLKFLGLSGNKLSTVRGDMWVGLAALHHLKLSKNVISHIESAGFSALTNCKAIDLSVNQLTSVNRNMWIALRSLEKLSLEGNSIHTIDAESFVPLKCCTTLNLDSNNLTVIALRTFQGLASLTHLSVGRNKITSLESKCFSTLSKLKELRLDGNLLSALDFDSFGSRRPSRHLTLDLSWNPLICDEKLCWIHRGLREGWIQFHKVWYKPAGEELNCTNYPGASWKDVNLHCSKTRKWPKGIFSLNSTPVFSSSASFRQSAVTEQSNCSCSKTASDHSTLFSFQMLEATPPFLSSIPQVSWCWCCLLLWSSGWFSKGGVVPLQFLFRVVTLIICAFPVRMTGPAKVGQTSTLKQNVGEKKMFISITEKQTNDIFDWTLIILFVRLVLFCCCSCLSRFAEIVFEEIKLHRAYIHIPRLVVEYEAGSQSCDKEPTFHCLPFTSLRHQKKRHAMSAARYKKNRILVATNWFKSESKLCNSRTKCQCHQHHCVEWKFDRNVCRFEIVSTRAVCQCWRCCISWI